MPTIQHSVLSGSDLHEPKGINIAGINQVYVADGAGSGAWKTIRTNGWEDIANAGSVQSLVNGTWTKLTNDGLGADTMSTHRLPNYSAVWNTSTNSFNFGASGLSVGDTVDLRVDLEVTTTGANDDFNVRLSVAEGTGTAFTVPFADEHVKTPDTNRFVYYIPMYIGSVAVLNNPTSIEIRANQSGTTALVKGWFVRSTPLVPVLV